MGDNRENSFGPLRDSEPHCFNKNTFHVNVFWTGSYSPLDGFSLSPHHKLLPI